MWAVPGFHYLHQGTGEEARTGPARRQNQAWEATQAAQMLSMLMSPLAALPRLPGS